MRYLSLAEVVDLHGRILETTGGASGVRDLAYGLRTIIGAGISGIG